MSPLFHANPTLRSGLFAAALLVGFAQNAFAGEGMVIRQAWAKASHVKAFERSKMGVAYLTIENKGAEADSIVKIETPRAAMAEIHEMGADENGMPYMREVADTTLAPGESMVMQPGGMHLMLMQMDAPLKEGEVMPVTVTFAHAAPQTVGVEVYPFRSQGPEAVQ